MIFINSSTYIVGKQIFMKIHTKFTLFFWSQIHFKSHMILWGRGWGLLADTQNLPNTQRAFLAPIGEIIISWTNVMETALLCELQDHSFKRSRCIVQKHINRFLLFHRCTSTIFILLETAVVPSTCHTGRHILRSRIFLGFMACPHNFCTLKHVGHLPR